ncbi:MAG: GNAT family N-acetyltransferase [Pseudomonadota bacterium]
MTPRQLADLHARAFAPERGWTEDEFISLCSAAHVQLYTVGHGFALVRSVADEAELLTLAVDPDQRRQGVARALMRHWMSDSAAATAFLEVAADNTAAIALYTNFGFESTGRRKAYYARMNAARVDALLMQTALTRDRSVQTTR